MSTARTKRSEGRDEPILEPGLRIIDAHHHFFDLPGHRYMPDDLVEDMAAGHNVVATVYCESQAFTRKRGPIELRPLGEVEFANGVGAMYASDTYGDIRPCAAVVGHADLTLGSRIGTLLDRCMQAAPERYRGIRHVTLEYPDDRPFRYVMTYKPPAGILEHPDVPAALGELEKRGLSFDTAIFDPSFPALTALVDRFPRLTFILNHMGMAIGIDMSADEKAAVFGTWRASLQALSERPNVRCKIGGLGLPMWGFRLEERDDPVGYAELADLWRPYVETVIAAFGPQRCMMESNFPPDGRSCGYVPLWNAMKHITAGCSDAEKSALYHDTVIDTYRVELDI